MPVNPAYSYDWLGRLFRRTLQRQLKNPILMHYECGSPRDRASASIRQS